MKIKKFLNDFIYITWNIFWSILKAVFILIGALMVIFELTVWGVIGNNKLKWKKTLFLCPYRCFYGVDSIYPQQIIKTRLKSLQIK